MMGIKEKSEATSMKIMNQIRRAKTPKGPVTLKTLAKAYCNVARVRKVMGTNPSPSLLGSSVDLKKCATVRSAA